ncbi:anaerobic sulfatase maturase [Aliagarivorans marinus]|uniref:anaerobic sulfatase maturase n=1 Tax=Aliagarivorans marinus TaxID=561965 RepID=UPI0004043FD0|nr:anaerobic sulfatase maturase [Aliagarivorans marinus]
MNNTLSNTHSTPCHVMAKPSGAMCNLACDYCFYLEKEQLYPERKADWRMSDDTLERFIRQYIDAQPGEYVEFAWQGGEPTLLGLGFYQKVVALCDKHSQGKTVGHAFQTNGVLLDDAWCEFFAKHQFLVGISIDGPKELHDHYRVTAGGKGSHDKVIGALALFKKHQVEFNVLTVVNALNAQHPVAVYQYLKSLGAKYIQFIPLVERVVSDAETVLSFASPEQVTNQVTPESVLAKDYGAFLNAIFDVWVASDVGEVFVQTFDSTLASWLGRPPGVCYFAERCGHSFALEANGDLYQCDHYVYPDYRLGNIHQSTIAQMNQSSEARAFGEQKSASLNDKCKGCKYLSACYGGCPKHRFVGTGVGKPDHNYLCEGYYQYFSHTERAMKLMCELLTNGHPATEVMPLLKQERQGALLKSGLKPLGRNSPCVCGSGLKYKRCCGS